MISNHRLQPPQCGLGQSHSPALPPGHPDEDGWGCVYWSCVWVWGLLQEQGPALGVTWLLLGGAGVAGDRERGLGALLYGLAPTAPPNLHLTVHLSLSASTTGVSTSAPGEQCPNSGEPGSLLEEAGKRVWSPKGLGTSSLASAELGINFLTDSIRPPHTLNRTLW